MFFIFLLILTTLSIAGSAAFFSVYGLAQIFSGSFWPVVAMATSLEAGKLITASYAYRYWKKISLWMKFYLVAALIVLMVITSTGIFGFLSAAYQKDVLPLKTQEQQITLLEQEKIELEKLKQERIERKQQIDEQVANLPSNYVKGRQNLMAGFKDETNQLNTDVAKYTELIRDKTLKIAEIKTTMLNQSVHIGPIIYIAKILEQDTDNATKYLIFLIIFAFDPLAVILTIGANIAILERSREKKSKGERTITIEEKITEPVEEKETILDLFNEIEQEHSAHTNGSISDVQKELLNEIARKRDITAKTRTMKG